MEDDVVVEYGADLLTSTYGSGFPLRENTDDPDDEVYIIIKLFNLFLYLRYLYICKIISKQYLI